MGIYGDLQKKREESYDLAMEKRVRTWIEALIKHPLNNSSFREGIKDGVALCEVINACEPNKIKKIKNSPVMLFQRENFGNFCTAAKDFGVAENDLCTFEDIYDDKNMGQCLIMLIALARKVQYKTGYKGPILEDAVKQSDPNKREFTEKQLREAQNTIPLAFAQLAEGQKVKDDSRYTHHGIINDPALNPHNKKK